MKVRQVVKVCPLRKTWTASICIGKIQRYTKNELLNKAKAVISEETSQCSKIDEEIIKQLEDRIAKMDKKSKDTNIKSIKMTSEVKEWVKTNGDTIDETTLLVQ